ncbi:MAG TPA: TetR/AcrR family transcriptional regulator [Burkholderiaceae bacterium]|nr:TetR/AcrR family transcriptional regulator [Burkholderiaceae bacterium]
MPMIMRPAVRRSTPGRATYRHGDLYRALLQAGLELAREGGPDAIVLREATRRVGVVPNAAYRHFANRDALLGAVRSAALAALADAMEAEIARFVDEADPACMASRARARLRGVGTGYLRFARRETGLFRTAFAPSLPGPDLGADPARAGRGGLNPFELLGSALDEMMRAGALPAAHRPAAEFLAWSAVHGMALLVIDGPLRGIGEPDAEALGQRLIDMVEKGLT